MKQTASVLRSQYVERILKRGDKFSAYAVMLAAQAVRASSLSSGWHSEMYKNSAIFPTLHIYTYKYICDFKKTTILGLQLNNKKNNTHFWTDKLIV